jgi:ribonucleoside-diphosphate reductase alpha chain
MKTGTQLTGIREKLFLDRYALKDENGEPTERYPEETWHRVAKAVAALEKTTKLRKTWEDRFYQAMEDFKFCPSGRFLTAAGTGSKATTINCFVIPGPRDSRQGIIKTLEQMTEISARGGGVGFNLSALRPRGSYLKSVNGTSSGAVSWANLYSITTHDIIQQGGTRRGALMLMMWDWHPDIEEFITVKKQQSKILGANLSVCVSDKFMQAVRDDGDWELKFPVTDNPAYKSEWDGDLVEWEKKGYPVKTYRTVKAGYIWGLICESAWASAEPGVVFMDRYNTMNNSWYFEKNVATNPCGEQGLPAWGVCNLSSLNLAAFVNEGKFDMESFKDMVKVGVRFLDNGVDGETYIYPEMEQRQKQERRLGLGTMGLADALIKMQIRYGSEKAFETIEMIYREFRDTAYNYSVELAIEKGSFPKFDKTKYLEGGFIKTLPVEIRKAIAKHGIRNAFLLTEAPTGKISLLAGVNSGIEPVFSFSYVQKDRLGERVMYQPLYKEWVEKNGEENLPGYFVVADDLTPEEHVRTQALVQKYTDSSISKTVNAPQTHTVNDVKELYSLAYELGCKGISYMREGSREGTLIRIEEKKEIKKTWERPMRVEGSTYKMKTPVGTAFITVNHETDGSPVEVFINVGRAGSDVLAMAEALGRLISKFLKTNGGVSGVERAKVVIEQLHGISGARSIGFGVNRISSLPDAVAKAMAMDMGLVGFSTATEESDKEEPKQQTMLGEVAEEKKPADKKADLCPECGNASLVHEMGCKTCYGCGYSEC